MCTAEQLSNRFWKIVNAAPWPCYQNLAPSSLKWREDILLPAQVIDNKQPVTWFWKTSKSLKAIVRCWPFPTCMTKDQFRRRRHNCRRVLNYYNLTWSLISHSIIVSNKGNKKFMSSILYTRCPPATAFVSDQVGGALVPWRQAGVLSGLCWVLSGNWFSCILGSGLLRHYSSSWNLP